MLEGKASCSTNCELSWNTENKLLLSHFYIKLVSLMDSCKHRMRTDQKFKENNSFLLISNPIPTPSQLTPGGVPTNTGGWASWDKAIVLEFIFYF